MSATEPINRVNVPLNSISNAVLTTPQLQRAWCLMLTRAIWPTIDPHTALNVARWLFTESNGEQ